MAKDHVKTTEEYYDSEDADSFYYYVWGGEDIHVGLYDDINTPPISEASQKSVDKLASMLKGATKDHKILDVGAGYGGTARYIAKKYGCQVDCLNLSKKENKRNEEKNKEQGLSNLVKVYYGNFEDLPFEDNAYDYVIAQDAILHSDQKFKVFQEVDRVLKKGGDFIFTDPMQADDANEDELQPVRDRIHLDEMGSVKKYRDMAKKLGWKEVEVIEMPEQLVNHYSSVRETLIKKEQELKDKVVSTDYIEKMKRGLLHWIDNGKKGNLNWGFIHFRKE